MSFLVFVGQYCYKVYNWVDLGQGQGTWLTKELAKVGKQTLPFPPLFILITIC